MTDTKERTEKRRRSSRLGDGHELIGQGKLTPYLFSTPAILAVTAVLAIPVLIGIWDSLYQTEFTGAPREWVGIQNYVDMFQNPGFRNALSRTAIFATGALLLTTILGLVFAFALYNAIGRLRFLRAAILAPYLISNVAAAVMFRLTFNGQFGIVNSVLANFGIDGPSWFADPFWSMVVVIFTQVWTDLPLTILLLLGGLMTIDRTYLEAALVDGATAWQRAKSITIPLLAPQIIINTVWVSFSTVTGLGVVLPLTGGGPRGATQTLAVEMYLTAFRELRFHEGLAIATFVLILNLVLTLLYLRVGRRYEVEV